MWRSKPALVVAFIALTFPAMADTRAVLQGSSFACTVSPGWDGRASMPIRLHITRDGLRVLSPDADGHSVEGSWTVFEDNPVGVLAYSGAVTPPDWPGPVIVSAALILINRVNGVLRWTISGADSSPNEDHVGTCIDGAG